MWICSHFINFCSHFQFFVYFFGSVGRPPRPFSYAYIAQKQHYFLETASTKTIEYDDYDSDTFNGRKLAPNRNYDLFQKKGHIAMMALHHTITFYLPFGSLMLLPKLYTLFSFINMYSTLHDINKTHFPCTYNTNDRTGIKGAALLIIYIFFIDTIKWFERNINSLRNNYNTTLAWRGGILLIAP